MAQKHKRTWAEKLADSKDLPRTMVIPAPLEVDAFMRQIPEGKLATIPDIQKALARKHRVTVACPMTTGIFAWIAAHASAEKSDAGQNDATAYWRTLKTGGEINAKYPGGAKQAARHLRSEGRKIVKKGARFFVADYEKSLATLP